MKRYLERPKVCGKTGQLPPVVSRFCSRSACRKQGRLHKKLQRPTDHTSYPLMEVEPVQSADLCFQCNHLHWLTYTKGHLSMAYAKKNAKWSPPHAPWLGRRLRLLPAQLFASTLSESLNFWKGESEALIWIVQHAIAVSMMSHPGWMIWNDTQHNHIQQCKALGQNMWWELYIVCFRHIFTSKTIVTYYNFHDLCLHIGSVAASYGVIRAVINPLQHSNLHIYDHSPIFTLS